MTKMYLVRTTWNYYICNMVPWLQILHNAYGVWEGECLQLAPQFHGSVRLKYAKLIAPPMFLDLEVGEYIELTGHI